MRFAPISDPDGDVIVAQEEADRALERADSPLLHLGPLEVCRDCGYFPHEVAPGHWACHCDQWWAVA